VFFLAAFLVAAVLTPTTLVDTFVGTSGTQIGGPIDTFPGADLPFGMVQFSPDTPSRNAGGGYDYSDDHITGFSLTHLSGPGCSVFGDFAVLPVAGDVPADPTSAKARFSHASEESAPGWYAVSSGIPAVRSELAVTARTGIARFTFPATAQANIIVNASSNQAGVTASGVQTDNGSEISGSASSGFFCGMPNRYTIYFVAQFDRPFRQSNVWRSGPASAMVLTFDATRQRQVRMRVGISFVSAAGARANLEAENRGWDVIAVRDRATAAWDEMLRRIAVTGGTTAQQRTLYTALYHTLLHPNIMDDADGTYTGYDAQVHHVRPGHHEYANYSDWDIYRTEVPLIALIAPAQTSDMMQSLVDAYDQEGWLPRWPVLGGPSSVMGGDSVDPVIAGAYAFGARDFDAQTALRAMVKGATSLRPPPAQGWYYERWELDDDLRRGYIVNTHTTSVAPVPNGASETLEYALDDFAISQLAYALKRNVVWGDFAWRSSNWTTLFDTATGVIAPRDADGAFMDTPITENGQSGFQEGNAAQYTWMVPQDLRDLFAAMGGRSAATAKLDAFFSQLNAGQDKPFAWLGNEPSLGVPWAYLTAGEPWRAQAVIHEALTTLYGDTPDGIPGNDDLGTMSAWYVWCAMGLYPQEPATRYLDVGAPMFDSVHVASPDGTTIDIHSPHVANEYYVQRLRVTGRTDDRSWITLPYRGHIELDVSLGASPNKRWASAPKAAPPSHPDHVDSIVPLLPASTSAEFLRPAPLVSMRRDGSDATLDFAIANRSATERVRVYWKATLPTGMAADGKPGGSVVLAPGTQQHVSLAVRSGDHLSGGFATARIDGFSFEGAAKLQHLDIPIRIVGAGDAGLAYVVNRFGNSIMPVDLRSGTTLPEMAVGEEPRVAALSRDGARLFVVNSGDGNVSVVDTRAGNTISKITVGFVPMGLAMTPDGKTLWVSNNEDNDVEPIDTTTLHAGVPLHVGMHPRDLVISPDGLTMYVSNNWSNSVTPIDLRTQHAGNEIPVGLRPAGLALTPDGRRLYVANSASNDVTPVDLSGAQPRPQRPIAAGVSPLGIAISPDGHIAYVANHANSTVTPIDLQTNTARAPIEVGGAPASVMFSNDGRLAYVVLTRDNAYVAIDVATGRVGAPVLLGNGPISIVER
jgi:predicted alpha-1,2-mannosidase